MRHLGIELGIAIGAVLFASACDNKDKQLIETGVPADPTATKKQIDVNKTAGAAARKIPPSKADDPVPRPKRASDAEAKESALQNSNR